jgi:hypothetical protein
MTMLSLPRSGGELKRSQALSIFTIKKTHSRERERDQRERWTGRVSFGRLALSSQETSTPIANDRTQDAKCSRMLLSGKA